MRRRRRRRTTLATNCFRFARNAIPNTKIALKMCHRIQEENRGMITTWNRNAAKD